MPEDCEPTGVEHGRALLARAQAEQQTAQALLDRATENARKLQRDAGAARETARDSDGVARVLTVAPGDGRGWGAPFAGGAEQAEEERKQLDGRLQQCGDGERLSTAVEDLKLNASNEDFNQMSSVARRQMLGMTREALAAQARDRAGHLRQRLATITRDLETANRHRQMIVERQVALTEDALKTLRTAQRLSGCRRGSATGRARSSCGSGSPARNRRCSPRGSATWSTRWRTPPPSGTDAARAPPPGVTG